MILKERIYKSGERSFQILKISHYIYIYTKQILDNNTSNITKSLNAVSPGYSEACPASPLSKALYWQKWTTGPAQIHSGEIDSISWTELHIYTTKDMNIQRNRKLGGIFANYCTYPQQNSLMQVLDMVTKKSKAQEASPHPHLIIKRVTAAGFQYQVGSCKRSLGENSLLFLTSHVRK